ncbi:TonB-dependent receptor, partial [candidate division KSB1 bacterium]|nr:TonB-dependent receptor [candidate division KSB1 bacterium]NIR69395.1 TonB-dependent receptor [candidate division KSB1 bacterium]NIS22745.1 TonB-dependent receptor [candidate division KSB1 bacterium]NIT69591.1 TonB-dependent receptor [candidate division KSB1 bacterium]NIU23253.1 TonB-dependent receptor [candidate division KSB1 bacterium]
MSCKLYKSVVSICICLISVSSLYGGITGTISGTVLDKKTGQVLPGAAIIVEGTTMWAMADKNGHYLIQNLPAGTYDVSATMIGYSKLTKKNVQINVDLDTDLHFELTTKVLPLEEVVVTEKRELIHSEITSSTYFISGKEINDKFPIDSYRQAISLLPGVVGDHFRGGRETEVTYMLDGLPIQGVLSREISSYFPNSSIVEMMVQTGGYTAEYGQASSGIVNMVTKDGGNKVEGDVKIYSDFFDTGVTNNDNTRRLEFNIGGPLTIGLGGPVINANYFVSADLNLSDTPHRNQMRQVFDSPVFSNYNINSKLSLDISNNTLLSLQGLVSNWNWRRFDPQWELNLTGLAEHRHNSHRISASLTHTFSPKFFGSLRVANYSYKRSVLGSEKEQPNLIFEDSGDPKSLIIAGEQPWNEETQEDVGIVKLDFVGQLNPSHLLKTGIEIQDYQATSQALRFDHLLSRDTDNSITFNKLSSNYEYSPKVYSLYAQDKFDFHGMTANLGLRYDFFSPRVTLNSLPDDFVKLRSRLKGPVSSTESENHNPLSPRLGISIPLSENERLHANYGWYYQLPPLYYYYVNNNHNVDSYLP